MLYRRLESAVHHILVWVCRRISCGYRVKRCVLWLWVSAHRSTAHGSAAHYRSAHRSTHWYAIAAHLIHAAHSHIVHRHIGLLCAARRAEGNAHRYLCVAVGAKLDASDSVKVCVELLKPCKAIINVAAGILDILIVDLILSFPESFGDRAADIIYHAGPTLAEFLYMLAILQWMVFVDYSLYRSEDHIKRRYKHAVLPILVIITDHKAYSGARIYNQGGAAGEGL